MDIERNLRTYLDDRRPTARYTSFDYCFNYFQSQRESGQLSKIGDADHLQSSCLHLGFYLASWGMLRASSVLLQRSVKHFAPVVDVIATTGDDIWGIDTHCYSDDTISKLIEIAKQIRKAFPEPASDILVTKIMLGVFGCVPAFDTYFKNGFGVWTFGRKSLRKVASFYEQNAAVIESHRVPTIDFNTGEKTKRQYTRAKVIDMIFFIEGGLSGDVTSP